MQTQDNWYLYDQANRFTLSMGTLYGGTPGTSETDTSASIVLDNAGSNPHGVSIAYDAANSPIRLLPIATAR